MQTGILSDFATGDNEILVLDDPRYCRNCDVIPVEPGDIYCAQCADELCVEMAERY